MKSFSNHPIVNIVRTELVTKEETPRVLCIDTVSSAQPNPAVSEGEETELRVRNTILAQECLEDIIKGYDITLKDCAMSRDLLEVLDGGESVTEEEGVCAGYRSPAAGAVSQRTRFTLRIYTEEKDYGGDTVGYFRFTFPNCCGKPAKFSFENGSFTTPEYTARSRPPAGGRALTVECLDTLPVCVDSSSQLPQDPEEGFCIVATLPIVAGSVELDIGDTAYFDGEKYVRIA